MEHGFQLRGFEAKVLAELDVKKGMAAGRFCVLVYPGDGRLPRHGLTLVALRYFELLGHDSQHRMFKFFAREVAKAKAPSGGHVDYTKLANAKLDGMATAEIRRFLMVCALASDLYFPSYLSSAALPKDSTLAKEAAHHKINANRVLREIRGSSAKQSPKPKTHSKSPLSAPRKR